MWKTLAAGRARLFAGDCRDALDEIPANSIDAVSCDPPYELASVVKRFGKPGSAPAKHGTDGLYARASAGFMGQTWDTGEVAFDPAFWREIFRVLKPGGHVLAMGGTRTYHHLAMAIEMGGGDVRDQLAWVYGTGFPKSHDHGDGRGTALKPSWEPMCLARKPLSEKTIMANLEKWGTGVLWIDRSRVPPTGEVMRAPQSDPSKREGVVGTDLGITRASAEKFQASQAASIARTMALGRWPANLLHDGSDEVIALFPISKDGVAGKRTAQNGEVLKTGLGATEETWGGYGGEGSAARFFYSAKTSKADRTEGTEHLTPPEDAKRTNWHPTVKPTPLCEWMNGLICPPGGVILDPFMGSGSTGKAAIRGGFQFIGCEMTPEYMPIAEARIAFEAKKVLENAEDDY
jgi:site-specific DNA-methyltransferase (adenine-specific)